MNRSMREKITFIATATLLIGGLILFGCSRSEPDAEAMPREQQNEHNHGDHAHDE